MSKITIKKPIDANDCNMIVQQLNKLLCEWCDFDYFVQTEHPHPATTSPKQVRVHSFAYFSDPNKFVLSCDGEQESFYSGAIYAKWGETPAEGEKEWIVSKSHILKLIDFVYWDSLKIDTTEETIEFASRDKLTDTMVVKTLKSTRPKKRALDRIHEIALDGVENKKKLLLLLNEFIEDSAYGSPFALLMNCETMDDSTMECTAKGYRFSRFYFKRTSEFQDTTTQNEGEWMLWGRCGDGEEVCIFGVNEIEGEVILDEEKRELFFIRNKTTMRLKRVRR